MFGLILALIFSTIFLIVVATYVKTDSRCSNRDQPCFDGNGRFQHKARGTTYESTEMLLKRIDWAAKHGDDNRYVMPTSFIAAYFATIFVFFVLFAYNRYLPMAWEFIVSLLIVFLVIFSVFNLFGFHGGKYPYYYIRNNVKHIQEKYNYERGEPEKPKTNKVAHRTEVKDFLES